MVGSFTGSSHKLRARRNCRPRPPPQVASRRRVGHDARERQGIGAVLHGLCDRQRLQESSCRARSSELSSSSSSCPPSPPDLGRLWAWLLSFRSKCAKWIDHLLSHFALRHRRHLAQHGLGNRVLFRLWSDQLLCSGVGGGGGRDDERDRLLAREITLQTQRTMLLFSVVVADVMRKSPLLDNAATSLMPPPCTSPSLAPPAFLLVPVLVPALLFPSLTLALPPPPFPSFAAGG